VVSKEPIMNATRTRGPVFWSWMMLPATVVTFVAAYFVGTLMTGALDLAEGEMLSSAGLLGWTTAVLVMLLMVFPLVVGVVLARLAVRRGEGSRAVAPLVVNAVLLGYLVLSQVIQLVASVA
jgi:hypothetical protein